MARSHTHSMSITQELHRFSMPGFAVLNDCPAHRQLAALFGSHLRYGLLYCCLYTLLSHWQLTYCTPCDLILALFYRRPVTSYGSGFHPVDEQRSLYSMVTVIVLTFKTAFCTSFSRLSISTESRQQVFVEMGWKQVQNQQLVCVDTLHRLKPVSLVVVFSGYVENCFKNGDVMKYGAHAFCMCVHTWVWHASSCLWMYELTTPYRNNISWQG